MPPYGPTILLALPALLLAIACPSARAASSAGDGLSRSPSSSFPPSSSSSSSSSSPSSSFPPSSSPSPPRSGAWEQTWSWPKYRKIQRTCMPWRDPITRVGNCGTDVGVACNVTYLMEQCDTHPLCNAFNSNGFLKSCGSAGKDGARCDCDTEGSTCLRGLDIYSSSDPSVMYGCDHADLYVLNGVAPPPEWVSSIAASAILYGSPEPNICYMPEVGNGFVGSVVGADAIYVAGLYNGACGTVRRARVPSTLLVSITNGKLLGGALDMARGMYLRRWAVPVTGSSSSSSSTSGGAGSEVVQVEQRIYAHRTLRHILVTEFTLVNSTTTTEGHTPSSAVAVDLMLSTPFDPLHQTTSGPGNNCAGGFTIDFKFEEVDIGSPSFSSSPFFSPSSRTSPSQPLADAGVAAYNGNSTERGDKGEVFLVSVITSVVPPTVHLDSSGAPGSNSSVAFLTAIATSIEFPDNTASNTQVQGAAQSAFNLAALLGPADLLSTHVEAWGQLWVPGIEVTPTTYDDESVVERAADVAAHINSSTYFLFSSIREDWSAEFSPGGIASSSYDGATFMDADWWMEPSLYLLNPSFARSILEYRYTSLPESRNLASMFGYNGSMFAWTAAYLGRPFGCCDAKGGYEDCLEQHVTGDVAFSVWQYYQAQRNFTWLVERGWPLVHDIAEFHMSRVTPQPNATYVGNYSILGVLPIDEWCVDSGCGCEEPGVDNDAQMNAVAMASLLAGAKIADLLGYTSDRTKLWRSVGENIVLLMNRTESGQVHHNQFTSKTCPGGWGGSHYRTSHTVCPEDVMMLSYPLGDFLNISTELTRADAELFIPITCLENAGMTTPIHTIVWLALGNETLAQAEFNRSMHAACYGPFNVRNEVDKHPDIIGGHFDNSHFLTGEGGFLQAVLNGYGGLRIVEQGLKLLHPYLPEHVGSLRMRNLSFRSLILTISVTATDYTIETINGEAFCLIDSEGASVLVRDSHSVPIASFAYPAFVREFFDVPSCGQR